MKFIILVQGDRLSIQASILEMFNIFVNCDEKNAKLEVYEVLYIESQGIWMLTPYLKSKCDMNQVWP